MSEFTKLKEELIDKIIECEEQGYEMSKYRAELSEFRQKGLLTNKYLKQQINEVNKMYQEMKKAEEWIKSNKNQPTMQNNENQSTMEQSKKQTSTERQQTEAEKIYKMLDENYETLSHVIANLDRFTNAFYPLKEDESENEKTTEPPEDFTSQVKRRLEIQGKMAEELRRITDHLCKFV